MAGLGRRTFAAGEVLTASNVMAYLQDQAVMNFAGTAARGSAIGTAVSEGMVSYLADSNMIETYSGTAWERQSGGLVPIAPTSVTVASGSASYTAIGVITVSGATSISIDGIFSSAYKNYYLTMSGNLGSTAVNWLLLRFRTGGSTVSSANYAYSIRRMEGGSLPATDNTAQAESRFCIFGDNAGLNTFSIDIHNPNLSIATNFFGDAQSSLSGTWNRTMFGGAYNATTAFDGIYIFPEGSNLSGTIQVFGYND